MLRASAASRGRHELADALRHHTDRRALDAEWARREPWRARAFDLTVGARLRGRRGTVYGITQTYRKNRQPFAEDLQRLLALLAETL